MAREAHTDFAAKSVGWAVRNEIANWLAGDWIVLGTHVQHKVVVIAAIALVTLLVAWLERPKRAPARHVSAQS
jgi:hypothetical protein